MTHSPSHDLSHILAERFSDAPDSPDAHADNPVLRAMAMRGSCRAFTDAPVPLSLLQTLCAVTLASPTKSDLQQRDIVLVSSAALRRKISALVAGQSWVADAPMLAIFCGNNRRQRLLHEWQEVAFANDHLDALFNAIADAAIALGAFVTAAEAVGLGCCPISAVRNEADALSELLGLPDHVFPLAGLAIGYPAHAPVVSKRLPLCVTVHEDRYSESGLREAVEAYDASREAAQPYASQRFPALFGQSASYGWSQDKVRQYSQPERADFGAFVRKKGFTLT